MTRARLYALIGLLLVLTVPWWFGSPSDSHIAGLPIWAAYSLAMSILFAVVMAVLLHRFWALSAGGEDGEGDD